MVMVGGNSGIIPQVNPIFNNCCAFCFKVSILLLSIYLYVCNYIAWKSEMFGYVHVSYARGAETSLISISVSVDLSVGNAR